ncbi:MULTISPECIES: YfjI family protein [unclassified Maridesulfovibrio]|uniref:YfjI family protein n=1 Tax=unclassified Maridesulfovibrio TaxID=2794999 RepID=UPI003B40AA59
MNESGTDILSMFGNKAPVPLGPQFPPSLSSVQLPPVLADYSFELSEALQVPYEMVLCNLLGVLSTAAQRRFHVQIKEGYEESLNLYLLSPLPPGERKSAVTQAARRPLIGWENEQEKLIGPLAQEARSKRMTLERAIEHRRNMAAKAKNSQNRDSLIQEIRDLEDEMPELITIPRLLADDITPECLAMLMEQQSECMSIIEAEGGLFDTFAGRYSRMPNLDLILKSFSGEPCRVDRKHGQFIGLKHPLLTICVTTQPDVLRGMAGNPEFRGRGFLARFLYFFGQSRLGYRVAEPPQVSLQVERAFLERVEFLLSLKTNSEMNAQGQSLLLSAGAYESWKNFFLLIEGELRPGSSLENMTDWAGKVPGQVARLAGLLHLASAQQIESKVEPSVMFAATELGKKLVHHARYAFHDMGCDDLTSCAQAILKWITDRKIELFTGRECQRAIRGRFPKKKQIEQGLTMLVEFGYVVVLPVHSSGPGRPPSPSYQVHPAVHAAEAIPISNPSQPTHCDTVSCATGVLVGAGEGGKPPFEPSVYASEMEVV